MQMFPPFLPSSFPSISEDNFYEKLSQQTLPYISLAEFASYSRACLAAKEAGDVIYLLVEVFFCQQEIGVGYQ